MLDDFRAADAAILPTLVEYLKVAERSKSRPPQTAPTEPAMTHQAQRAFERDPAIVPASHNAPTEPPKSESPSSPTPIPDNSADAASLVTPHSPLPTPHSGLAPSFENAIRNLEQATQGPVESRGSLGEHVRLRLLYLAAGRRDDALRPIAGLPAAEQEYWVQQLYAISLSLGQAGELDPKRCAALAAGHLEQAKSALDEQSALVVRNLAFCTEVTSFGIYEPLARAEFSPGQQVLLYAELDHFASEDTEQGHHTALRASYQILDAQGHRVAHDEFAVAEEHCRNRRRDYFVRYYLSIPERIYDGAFTLQLTVEDIVGDKIGQSSVEFQVHSVPRKK